MDVSGFPLTSAIMLDGLTGICQSTPFRYLIGNYTFNSKTTIQTLDVVGNTVVNVPLTIDHCRSITQAVQNGLALPLFAVGLFCKIFGKRVQIDNVLCGGEAELGKQPVVCLKRDDMQMSQVTQTYTRRVQSVCMAHLYSHEPQMQSLVERFTGIAYTNMSQLSDLTMAVDRLVQYLSLDSPKQIVLNSGNPDVQAMQSASAFRGTKDLSCVTHGTINTLQNAFECNGGADIFVNDRKAFVRWLTENFVWGTETLDADMATAIKSA